MSNRICTYLNQLYRNISLVVSLLLVTLAQAQDNYVRVETFRVPVTDPNNIPALNHPDKVTAFSYIDGLGRPLQSVAAQAGPDQEDIVSFSKYDPATGKQLEAHLPYTKIAGTPGEYRPLFATEQPAFYNQGGDLAADSKPYSLYGYENSPLGRVKSVIAPGSDYHTNNKKTIYHYSFYPGGTDIVHWKLDGAGLPVRGTTYGANSIRITEQITPDDRKTQTVIDGRGLNIASRRWDGTAWNTTYNVYDEMGRLRYIIPPKAANEPTLNTTQINGYLFEYKYDGRGRVIESRSPGTGWIYAVYDKWNRLVMTRHDGQKDGSTNSWTFYKYDKWNRQVISGVVTTSKSRPTIQSELDVAIQARTLIRYEDITNNADGYTLHNSFPNLTHADYNDYELHSINYYDDYNFLGNTGWDAENLDLGYKVPVGFSMQGVPPLQGYVSLENNHTVTTVQASSRLAYGESATVTIPAGVTLKPGSHIVASNNNASRVKGLPTGSKVLVLNTTTWLNSVQYYDDRLRPVQRVSENHLGGTDRIMSELNYTTGEVNKTLLEHTGSESVDLLTEYTYDHVGRLLQTHETVDGGIRTLVGDYKYNALGELTEKNLHSTDGGTSFLQSVDYRYNIRQQLTAINDDQLTPGTETNRDVFGMKLNYTSDVTVNGQNVPGSFDGNIASASWNSDNDPTTAGIQGGVQSIYGYSYDKLNQLTAANYATWNTTNTDWSNNGGKFDMTVDYDGNGNRSNLTRKAEGTMIDSLSYAYGTNNQVTKVTDSGTGDGFDNNNIPTGNPVDYSGEYAYDAMGNMTSDAHKEIEVTYNHFQLVDKIEFLNGTNVLTTVAYTYDATGTKLSKAVTDADGNTIAKVDYAGLVEYLDNEINQVFIEGGRAYKQNGAYHNEYFIGDYQGNNRVAFGNLPDRNVYTAGMETENSAIEESEFDFPTGIRSTAENHTPLRNESVALNGTVPGREVGPAKVLNIAAGDEVDLEVWAKYTYASWNNTSIANIASILSSTFGSASAGTGAEGASGALNNALGNPAVNGLFANGQSQEPNAYLQYMFFDASYNFVSGGSGFVSVGAESQGKFAKLSSGTQTYNQAGYLFIYVVNESNQNANVYFDDLKIVHAGSNTNFKVSQVNEYYPYGMPTSNSWRDEGYIDPGMLYQAAFSTYDSLTGFYDFQFRNYDPALGQFFAVDPLATLTSSYSPYHANYNNPVMYTDPLGLYPDEQASRRYYDERDDDIDYEPMFYTNEAFFYGSRWDRWDGSYGNGMSIHGTGSFNWGGGATFGHVFNFLDNAFAGNGGYWHSSTPDQAMYFANSKAGNSLAFAYGANYNNFHNSWGNTNAGSLERAAQALNDSYVKPLKGLGTGGINLAPAGDGMIRNSNLSPVTIADFVVNPSGGGIRGQDCCGNGSFGASRLRNGISVQGAHVGIDLIAGVGQVIVSPVSGKQKWWIGAKTKKPIHEIIPSNTGLGFDKIWIHYVNGQAGDKSDIYRNVYIGQPIGRGADLSRWYDPRIINHIHVEFFRKGRKIDPTPFLFPSN